jgi:hypothetical protein
MESSATACVLAKLIAAIIAIYLAGIIGMTTGSTYHGRSASGIASRSVGSLRRSYCRRLDHVASRCKGVTAIVTKCSVIFHLLATIGTGAHVLAWIIEQNQLAQA